MREYADLQLRTEPKNLRIGPEIFGLVICGHLKKNGSPTILRTRSALGVDRHISNFLL